jgi:enoyl-CoA hydratase/carnithine racemase
METEVQDALLRAEQDDGVRVIILTGAGRGFCAGADMATLDLLTAGGEGRAQLEQQIRERLRGRARAGVRPDFQGTYSYFPALSKPVLAAINGPAVGLGLIIALYCDLRFASDQARLCTAFSRRGLIAEYGIAWMLPRLIGLPHALDLLLSARLIDAAEALRMGLVNRVIPHDRLLEEVRAYAVELATLVSPRSLRVMKRQIYEGLFQTLAEANELANEELVQSLSCADFREGVAHFLEKRPPAFTGK